MISGIILGAGSSQRMGKQKLTLELAGKTMVQRVIDAFTSSSLDEVILVLSPSTRWRPEPTGGLRVVINARTMEGISTSVRAGIQALDRRTDAVLIGLADKPFLLESTVEALIQQYRKSAAEIVLPVHGGERGNPILFRKSLFRQLSRLKGDVGAKQVVESGEHTVAEVPVDDVGVLFDIDTPTDARKARKMLPVRSRKSEGKARK